MNSDYKASFRVEQEDWEDFKEVCDQYGLSASAVLRQFVNRFGNQDIDISDIFAK